MTEQDADFRTFQRTFFQALRDRPLDLENPEDAKLYEPLHDDDHDPVVRLMDTIDFSVGESVQLVAGFRGTGKTTEFSRLEKLLWSQDYLVIRVDLDEYLDLHSPIDIIDFLLVLSGAISARLVDDRLLGEEATRWSWWDRLSETFEISLESTGVSMAPFSFTLGLKSDPSVRARLREALKGQLPALIAEVHAHHASVLEALEEKWGVGTRLVVIVDSLEHIRGTLDNDHAVFRSVQSLFFSHARHLQLPSTHMVLSVPAFLALQADNLAAQFVNGAVQAWSSCRVVNRDGTPNPAVVKRLVHLVERRGDWRRVLPDEAALHALIRASGGYLRDLLNMLIEAIHLARRGRPPEEVVDRILAVSARSYQPLYADEIRILKKIALAKDLGAVTVEEQPYLLRFLDSHLVLCYLNDDFWYDVHPLVREQVLAADDDDNE